MAIYKYNEIKMVHLELTSKCNAGCPMCSRSIQGGVLNPLLPLTELSLEQIKKIFPVDFIRQLSKVFVCGNYGDPMMAKEAAAVFKYFRESNSHLNLGIHSNGGARTEDFWKDIAQTLSYCRFGIDGLSDTNHLYRQNVKWTILERNVRAFIESGGHAEWDFLVFKHNEHQVEAARELAASWGFKKFNVKSTSRFFSTHRQNVRLQVPAHNSQGQKTHDLERSLLPEYHNSFYNEQEQIIKKHGTLSQYWDQAAVSCKVAKEKSLYISAEGLVFPCCWIGNELYSKHMHSSQNQVLQLLSQLPAGKAELSALQRPLEQVLQTSAFNQKIEDSWSLGSIEEGKIKVCARTCGQELNPFENQFLKNATV